MIKNVKNIRTIRGFKNFLSIIQDNLNINIKYERVSNKPNWSVYYNIYLNTKFDYDIVKPYANMYNSNKYNKSYINVFYFIDTRNLL